MTHVARALQSHDLSEKGINLLITYILFWPHKDMEGLPRWEISSMLGPPTRQHIHERRYRPVTHSFNPISRTWNGDFGGQMIFGNLVGLKFTDICLTGEEKPHRRNLSRPGIECGPAAWQARMLPMITNEQMGGPMIKVTNFLTFVLVGLWYTIN